MELSLLPVSLIGFGSALYVASGHWSLRCLEVTAQSPDERLFFAELRRGEAAALTVWAVYMLGWPVLYGYALLSGRRGHPHH
jgi:hypothetical protein